MWRAVRFSVVFGTSGPMWRPLNNYTLWAASVQSLGNRGYVQGLLYTQLHHAFGQLEAGWLSNSEKSQHL